MAPDTAFHCLLKRAPDTHDLFSRLEWNTRTRVLLTLRDAARQAILDPLAVAQAEQAVRDLTGMPRIAKLVADALRLWLTRGAGA